MSDVGKARKAKEELKAAIGSEPWCVGIGVEREDGVGFIVRVTLREGVGTAERARVPGRMGEVLIKVIEGA